MKLFYFLLTFIALGLLITAPKPQPSSSVGQLNLCRLREGQKGKVTGIITKIEVKSNRYTTITNPKNGCSAVVISTKTPTQLQRGISFTAHVQAGYLKLPTNFVYQDNLGTVIPYQEITNYITTKPRSTSNYNKLVISLEEDNGRRKSLYISRTLANQIKYNSYNTFYYDSNNTIQSLKENYE